MLHQDSTVSDRSNRRRRSSSGGVPERGDHRRRSVGEPGQHQPDHEQGVVDVQEIGDAVGHHEARHRVPRQHGGEALRRQGARGGGAPAVHLKTNRDQALPGGDTPAATGSEDEEERVLPGRSAGIRPECGGRWRGGRRRRPRRPSPGRSAPRRRPWPPASPRVPPRGRRAAALLAAGERRRKAWECAVAPTRSGSRQRAAAASRPRSPSPPEDGEEEPFAPPPEDGEEEEQQRQTAAAAEKMAEKWITLIRRCPRGCPWPSDMGRRRPSLGSALLADPGSTWIVSDRDIATSPNKSVPQWHGVCHIS